MDGKNLVNAGNYWQLLIDGLSFLKTNLFESWYPLSDGIKSFATGLTKWFKVLQKDFPNFLANFYFDFVNMVPDWCRQILNIILTAIPIEFTNQPDPLDDDILIDGKKEMKTMPEIWSNFDSIVSAVPDLKLDLQSKSTAHVKSIVQKIEQHEEVL